VSIKTPSAMKLKNRRAAQEKYGKRQRRRFARQCAHAAKVRDGSQGPASKVRIIDPKTYQP
jgi:hypothetical protein